MSIQYQGARSQPGVVSARQGPELDQGAVRQRATDSGQATHH